MLNFVGQGGVKVDAKNAQTSLCNSNGGFLFYFCPQKTEGV